SLVPRPPLSPLFPYTTLFRSPHALIRGQRRKPTSVWVKADKSRASRPRPKRSQPRSCRRCHWPGRPSTKLKPHPRTPVTAELRRSEEHTSELQSRVDLVCRLL